VDGVMMLVEAVEVAITGVETTMPTWLLQTQIGEAEAVEDVVVAVVEVDLQWNATTAKVKVTDLEIAKNLKKKEVEIEDQWNAITVKVKAICPENAPNPKKKEILVEVVVVVDLLWNASTVIKKAIELMIVQNLKKKEVEAEDQWSVTTVKEKVTDLEIAQSQRNLETTAMMIVVVVAIKDNVETMMETMVGSQTKIKAEVAMEAGVTPLIRLINLTNGVLKDHNLKLKVAGVTRKNRKKKHLVDGRAEARKNLEVEMTGAIKVIHRTLMIKMEVAAGAEHPFVYKIEIKFTVSF